MSLAARSAAVAAACLLASAAAASDGSRGLAFPEGATRSWRWRTASVVTPAAPRGPQALEVAWEGTLHVRVLTTGAAPVLAVEASALAVTIAGRRSPDLERALARPLVVELEPGGAFREIRFAPALARTDRRLIESALRMLEFVVPPSAAPAWEAVQSDANGRFVARYRRDGAEVVRAKERYLAAAGAPPPVTLERAIARAQIDDGPWLARVAGEERSTVAGPSGEPLARVDARCSLEPLPGGPGPRLALWDDALLREAVPLDGPTTTAASAWETAEIDRARGDLRRGGVTLAGLLAAIARNDDAARQAARRLVLWLRAFPPDAIPAAERVPRLSEAAAEELRSALGAAGTPESQRALAGLAARAGARCVDRVGALRALATVERPTVDALARIETVAASRGSADVRAAAFLALGALAPRATPRSARERLVQSLRSALQDAREPALQGALVAALADARADVPLATLHPALASTAPAVRAAAATLLGRASDPEARPELLRLAELDAAPAVRAAAVDALSSPAPDPAENGLMAARLTSRAEPDGDARAALVRYLARSARTFPENRDLLERELATELDPRVSRAIVAALAVSVAERRGR